MALSDYLPFLPRPPARFVTESGRRVYGLLARFETPGAVFHAAEKVRDAGYADWDVYSPFPIHDIEEAMGVRRTRLPYLVALVGFTGVALALAMQVWMNYIDFPLVVQGKPFNAWEPLVPIMFELGVLSAAFASLIGMLALNGLPRWHHPLMASEQFLRVSDDQFFICIAATDSAFDPDRTRALLEEAGAVDIELIED